MWHWHSRLWLSSCGILAWWHTVYCHIVLYTFISKLVNLILFFVSIVCYRMLFVWWFKIFKSQLLDDRRDDLEGTSEAGFNRFVMEKERSDERQLTILWLRCCSSLTAAASCFLASFGCCCCCRWWCCDDADDDGGCGCRTRLNGAYLHTRYMAVSHLCSLRSPGEVWSMSRRRGGLLSLSRRTSIGEKELGARRLPAGTHNCRSTNLQLRGAESTSAGDQGTADGVHAPRRRARDPTAGWTDGLLSEAKGGTTHAWCTQADAEAAIYLLQSKTKAEFLSGVRIESGDWPLPFMGVCGPRIFMHQFSPVYREFSMFFLYCLL